MRSVVAIATALLFIAAVPASASLLVIHHHSHVYPSNIHHHTHVQPDKKGGGGKGGVKKN